MADLPVQDLIDEGRQAAEKGQLDEACALFLQAAAKAAGSAETLTGIGAEIIKISRFGKAHDVLLQAIEAKPDHVPAISTLGELYLTIRQPAMAAACFEKITGLEPNDAKAWFSLGRARYEEKDMEKALIASRQAIKQGERTAIAYRLVLVILENLSRLDEMAEFMEGATRAHPDDELMQILHANLEARTGNQKAALQRLRGIKLDDKAANVAATVHYDMGRILDALGEYEAAFDAFSAANNHQAQVFTEKGFSSDKAMADLADIEALDLSFLEQASENPGERDHTAPVFQVGFPRSGTTLLSYILDAHSGIDIMQETVVLQQTRQKLMAKSGAYPALLAGLPDEDTRAAADDYLGACKAIGGVSLEKVIVDKVPLNLIHIPLIVRLFPDARLVLSLRHPCDACLSCFMQNFGENNEMANFLDLEKTVQYYARVMSLWLKFAEHLPLNVHVVKYEDLVGNLEAEARKLIAFLGLPWEDGVLAYREKLQEKGFLKTPSYSQVVKPLYTDSLERWRHYGKHFAPHKELLAPFLKHFGYQM